MGLLTSLRAILPACSATVTEGARDAPPQDTLRGPSVEIVRRAVACLPNTSELFATRESYRDLLYSVKASLPDHPEEALDIGMSWCVRWPGDHNGPNDPDIVEADWKRMKGPFRRGWPWLSELCERHSGGAWTRAEQWHEEVRDPVPSLFPPIDPAEAAGGRTYLFESAVDVAARFLGTGSSYLVKGLQDLGATVVVYGNSNAGKTFVCLDKAYHVAQGRPYGGMKVHGGPVLYVLSEGGRTGAPRRLEALRRKYGDAPDLHMLLTSIDLFDPEADIGPLMQAIAAFGKHFVLIVIDTLARAMAGGDENSTRDMGMFVRHAERLKTVYGSTTELVHHTGKDISKGARGSSALRAATDTEIELSPGQITVTKQRDIPTNWSSDFVLEPVEIGRDEDGDPIINATVALVQPGAGSASAANIPITRGEQQVLDAMAKVGATPDCPAKRARILESMVGASADSVKKHLAALLAKGRVTTPKPTFWALRPADDVSNSAEKWFDELG